MIRATLTAAQYAELGTKAQEAGLTVTGPSGTVSKDGVTLNYTYAEPNLQLVVVHKPFGLTVNFVENRLRKEFAEYGVDCS